MKRLGKPVPIVPIDLLVIMFSLVGMVAVVVFGSAGCSRADEAESAKATTPSAETFEIRAGTSDDRGVYHSVVELKIAIGSAVGTCSGSVIAPDLVLTAAHCGIDPRSPTQSVLLPSAITTMNASGSKRVAGKRLAFHQAYVPNGVQVNQNGESFILGAPDFMIVKFAEPLGYRELLQMATAIPDPATIPTVTMVGWGVDEFGRFAGRRVGTSTLAGFAPSLVFRDRGEYDVLNQKGSLIVRTSASGQISCRGDSGSPLLDSRKNIIGVLSMGYSPDESTSERSCFTAKNVTYVSVVPELSTLGAMIAGLTDVAGTSSWQNPANALDVNADGRISTLDALLVLADLNLRGPRALSTPRTSSDHFVDVTGDGRATARDVLLVIAYLSQLSGVRLTTTTVENRALYHLGIDDASTHRAFFDAWRDPASQARWTAFADAKANGAKARQLSATGSGRNGARWTLQLAPGTYQLQVSVPARSTNASRATYDIKFADGRVGERVVLDQRVAGAAESDGTTWRLVGKRFTLTKATDVSVFLTDLNAPVGSQIVADAVRAVQH